MAELGDQFKVAVHLLQRGRVAEVEDGYSQVLQRLDLLGRINSTSQDEVGFERSNLLVAVLSHRTADGRQGLGLGRVIGEFIAPGHLIAGANGEEDLGVGRCHRDDLLCRSG